MAACRRIAIVGLNEARFMTAYLDVAAG